ncbi:unnamed protein product [Symbiodinium sp. CCMP2592]|nr:unnamed protein product [Symbiodinium sp. CCMP2592]
MDGVDVFEASEPSQPASKRRKLLYQELETFEGTGLDNKYVLEVAFAQDHSGEDLLIAAASSGGVVQYKEFIVPTQPIAFAYFLVEAFRLQALACQHVASFLFEWSHRVVSDHNAAPLAMSEQDAHMGHNAPNPATPDQGALQQFHGVRRIFQTPDYNAVSREYWRQQGQGMKRGPPTPSQSVGGTPAEASAGLETPPTTTPVDGPTSSLMQPFSLQRDAALSVTAEAFGVDINQQNAVQEWCNTPIQTNQQVFDLIRAYHEKVIRPEYFSLVCQLEGGLRAIHDSVFRVKRELNFMVAENRQMQKYMVGTQLLTVGWPNHIAPEARIYMLCWLFSQVTECRTFLEVRGYLNDHNAHELTRFMNVLTMEPTTVPQGSDFYSSMTLITLKSFELRKAILARFGGSSGIPLYTDENTPVQGRHIKVAPCSPQWQRKLEAPIRVCLSAINAHPDHNARAKMVILWKSLTIMAPVENGTDFQEDFTAWARLHYFEKDGKFQGRLEVTEELAQILNAPAAVPTADATNLWQEHWYKVLWGNQLELDLADRQTTTQALQAAKGSGKGLNVGKSTRHWSQVAIHSSEYEPYPFELEYISVEGVYFSWDEMCDKWGATDHKVGDYSIATIQGKPPQNVVNELRATTTHGPGTGAPSASSQAAPAGFRSRPFGGTSS